MCLINGIQKTSTTTDMLFKYLKNFKQIYAKTKKLINFENFKQQNCLNTNEAQKKIKSFNT